MEDKPNKLPSYVDRVYGHPPVKEMTYKHVTGRYYETFVPADYGLVYVRTNAARTRKLRRVAVQMIPVHRIGGKPGRIGYLVDREALEKLK